jgi:hypothetical protein
VDRARPNQLDPVSEAARNPAMTVLKSERAIERRTERVVDMLFSLRDLTRPTDRPARQSPVQE